MICFFFIFFCHNTLVPTSIYAKQILITALSATPDLNTTVINDGKNPELKKISYEQHSIFGQKVVFKNESNATTTISKIEWKPLIARPDYQEQINNL